MQQTTPYGQAMTPTTPAGDVHGEENKPRPWKPEWDPSSLRLNEAYARLSRATQGEVPKLLLTVMKNRDAHPDAGKLHVLSGYDPFEDILGQVVTALAGEGMSEDLTSLSSVIETVACCESDGEPVGAAPDLAGAHMATATAGATPMELLRDTLKCNGVVVPEDTTPETLIGNVFISTAAKVGVSQPAPDRPDSTISALVKMLGKLGILLPADVDAEHFFDHLLVATLVRSIRGEHTAGLETDGPMIVTDPICMSLDRRRWKIPSEAMEQAEKIVRKIYRRR